MFMQVLIMWNNTLQTIILQVRKTRKNARQRQNVPRRNFMAGITHEASIWGKL